jgi:hypothetical protein
VVVSTQAHGRYDQYKKITIIPFFIKTLVFISLSNKKGKKNSGPNPMFIVNL